MDSKLIAGIVVVAVVVIGALFVVGSFNSLTAKSLDVDNQWSKVQTVYQERFDLVPNIAATVKSETAKETALLEDLAAARANYLNAKTEDGKVAASSQLDSAVFKFLALSESYPDLQYSKGYQDLRTVLEGQENRVRVERNRFNDAVRDYNGAVRSVPTNLVAGAFGFKERQFFSASAGAENAPDAGKLLN